MNSKSKMKKSCSVKRLLKKYYLMILRSKDSPHKIALGVGIGLCCGVAIPLGQLVLAVFLAFIFKANKVFAGAATFISNPYTSPIIYPFFCYLGSKIIGAGLTVEQIQKFVKDIIYSFSWNKILNMGSDLLICYIIGGTIVGVILGIAGYIVTYRIALIHKRAKEHRKQLKRNKYSTKM